MSWAAATHSGNGHIIRAVTLCEHPVRFLGGMDGILQSSLPMVHVVRLVFSHLSNAHDLGPFAVLFSATAAAPRIDPSTADKLLPGSRFDMRQVFATSPVVDLNLFRRGDDGDDGDGGNTLYCQP